MTIDDFISALCGVPRYARPSYIKTSDMLLRCWRYCRTDEGFRKEVYDRHGIEDRVLQSFDPVNSGSDRIIVCDAYSYFELIFRDVIIPLRGAEHRRVLTARHAHGKNSALQRKPKKKRERKPPEQS